MNSLQLVRDQLKADPDLVWVGERAIKPNFPYDTGGWHEFVFLVVALKTPCFDLEELEKRRLTLETGIKVEPNERFAIYGGMVTLGVVCFSEQVGKVTYTITDDAFLQTLTESKVWGDQVNNREVSLPMHRRVFIELLPSVEAAQHHLQRPDCFSMDGETWRRFEEGSLAAV